MVEQFAFFKTEHARDTAALLRMWSKPGFHIHSASIPIEPAASAMQIQILVGCGLIMIHPTLRRHVYRGTLKDTRAQPPMRARPELGFREASGEPRFSTF